MVPDLISPNAHIEFSRRIALSEVLRSDATSPLDLSKTRFVCNEKEQTRTLRVEIMGAIKETDTTVSKRNADFRRLMPPDSPARYLNFALIAFLVSHTSHSDTSLVKDLIQGMPLSGDIPLAHSLPGAEKPSKTTIADLL